MRPVTFAAPQDVEVLPKSEPERSESPSLRRLHREVVGKRMKGFSYE